MHELLCNSCGCKVRTEQVRWRPNPGYSVGCYWRHCMAPVVTAVMPTIAEARKEWREGRVSPRPKTCPTCQGRGWIWLTEYPIPEGESTETICIECKGARKIPRGGNEANQSGT